MADPSSSKLPPLNSLAKPCSFDESTFSYKDSTYSEILEDLQSRFIANLPPEELLSEERICFQVEQAHWYYEDFIREENPSLPSYTIKNFSEMFFRNCPILHNFAQDHEGMFNRWLRYKTRVPVCGAIMLDSTLDYCVLVKGWKASAGWSFPKGKINEHEPKEKCAIREVLEETGYNLAGQINPDDILELNIKDQSISLFVVSGVPRDFPFETRTRKEISKIEWFKLSDLPTWKRNSQPSTTGGTKFYLIAPFMSHLQQFIHDRKPRLPPRRPSKAKKSAAAANVKVETAVVDHSQESSSQSSGNDGPQTPSPNSSNATPQVVEHEESPPGSELSRLLSRLTASASINPMNQDASQTNAYRNSFTRPKEPGSLPVVDELHPSEATVPSSPGLSLRSVPRAAELQLSTLAASPVSLVSPTTSVSSKHSRRSSAAGDVSPYLSRSTEIPTSAKRLRELALLESVADESARMSVFLARQSPTPAPSLPGSSSISPSSAIFNGIPPPVSSSVVPQTTTSPVWVHDYRRPASAFPDVYHYPTAAQYQPIHSISNGESLSHLADVALMGRPGGSMSPMPLPPFMHSPSASLLPHQGLYTPPIMTQGPISGIPSNHLASQAPPFIGSQNPLPPALASRSAAGMRSPPPDSKASALLSILNSRGSTRP